MVNGSPPLTDDSVTFFYPCSTPYECSFFTVDLKKGTYILEAWGASGSTGIGTQGGCGEVAASAWRTGGGYSKGTLTVSSFNETLYLYFV